MLEHNPIVALATDVLASASTPRNVSVPDGFGEMSYANGDVYSGGFCNGLRHGRGQLLGVRGDCLTCEWQADEANGPGRWVSGSHDQFSTDTANGDVFTGHFKAGLPGPSSEARFVSRSGEVAEGKEAALRAFDAMRRGKEGF